MPRNDGTYIAAHVGRNIKDKLFEEAYGCIFKNTSYSNTSMKTDAFFDDFIERRPFDFINVSAPFQTHIIDYLDKTTPLAIECNLVNFVVNKGGILCGYNTEKYGIENLFLRHGLSVIDKNILIISSGNSSNTLKKYLSERRTGRIECCTETPNGEFPFESDNTDFDLVISTIPPEDKRTKRPLLDLSKYKGLETYVDFSYTPFRTPTMLLAKKLGIGFVGGMTKLIYEISLSSLILSRSPVPSRIWDAIKGDIACRHTNLYMIGLPTCDNDSFCQDIKKLLEEKNGKGTKSYLDTDELIQKSTNRRIKTLLESKEGAEFYLRTQKELSVELSKVEGRIVRVPCVLVCDSENYDLIAQKGYFVYLKKTDFNQASINKKSQISSIEDLKRMYRKYNATLESISDLTTMENKGCQKLIDEACEALSQS